ncbi:MAG: Na+/H+ antiporter NhaA [Chitinophagaceae bacterium]|nr:Na+/H+ antiporter NhaA [Chitinophagaceae bacterium]MCW5929222.1 Na+/H+ antiporter NhaA [Chitinophagaceae bacterium]
MNKERSYPIDRIVSPISRFIRQEKSGSIVLAVSVVMALLLANSSWSERYFHFFEQTIGISFNEQLTFSYSLHHWINDGLMAVFFFVVGLELKREIVGGELSNPRQAMLPIIAAAGGMIVPALIYLLFNPSGEVHAGWGIPMATDIAFALGVLYFLGKRVPLALKVFLTALAIVDDLGAVLVIAFFYTSEISVASLSVGFLFLAIMFAGNKLGIRNVLFYAVFGILGVWVAFLLSGVHATIAAVLAAFTIPADISVPETLYIKKVSSYLDKFKAIDPGNKLPVLTAEQLHLLEQVNKTTIHTMPPLQRLELAMHPFVSFVVVPVFALANAGVTIAADMSLFSTNIIPGVGLGLLVGKVTGVAGFTLLAIKLKIASFPSGMNVKNLVGLGFLAAIGFTMSLFITTLAFNNEVYLSQAKLGIFAASILGGVTGYFILSRTAGKTK